MIPILQSIIPYRDQKEKMAPKKIHKYCSKEHPCGFDCPQWNEYESDSDGVGMPRRPPDYFYNADTCSDSEGEDDGEDGPPEYDHYMSHLRCMAHAPCGVDCIHYKPKSSSTQNMPQARKPSQSGGGSSSGITKKLGNITINQKGGGGGGGGGGGKEKGGSGGKGGDGGYQIVVMGNLTIKDSEIFNPHRRR